MGFHSTTSSNNCAVELVSHFAFSARCIEKLCYLRQLLERFNCVRKLDKGTADPLVLYCTCTRTQELQIVFDFRTILVCFMYWYHVLVCFSLWYFCMCFCNVLACGNCNVSHVFNSVDGLQPTETRPPEPQAFGAACLSPCESCGSFQHIVSTIL